MIVNLKIYKFSDPDMYALHNAGISVPALMKLAIAYRARGKRLRIFIPDCLYCDLSGQKRHIPLKITIKDKVSIDYLRTALKEGNRTANIKIILRNCMVEQVEGPTLRDRQLVLAENARLMLETEDYKKYDDILILPPGTSKRSYYPMVLNRTVEIPDEKKGKKKTAITKQPEKKKAREIQEPAAEKAPQVNAAEPAEDIEAGEGFVDLSAVTPAPEGQGTDNTGDVQRQESPASTALWNDDTEEMTDEEADEDFFSQFESLG